MRLAVEPRLGVILVTVRPWAFAVSPASAVQLRVPPNSGLLVDAPQALCAASSLAESARSIASVPASQDAMNHGVTHVTSQPSVVGKINRLLASDYEHNTSQIIAWPTTQGRRPHSGALTPPNRLAEVDPARRAPNVRPGKEATSGDPSPSDGRAPPGSL